MMTHLIRPLVVGINNTLVFVLEAFDIYTIQPADLNAVAPFSLGFTVFVFALVLWLSLRHGRLFCNTLCPVGTFLGFLSRFSLFKIKLRASQCIGCRACEKVCKAGCLNQENSHIDFSRCVTCCNCLAICPTGALRYRPGWQNVHGEPVLKDAEKRDFMKQTLACFIAGGTSSAGAGQIEIYRDSKVPIIKKDAISPPGSGSLEHLTKHCTACHLCISACPTRVLQPAFLEYGLLGVMLPCMDFKTSYCDYECVVCTTVCPSGAILKQSVAGKKRIQVGKARFVRGNCVVYTQNTACGACAEHCPTKAVRMVLDKEVSLRAPKIDESICVGCGACEFACPTTPYKAIYVKSNRVHEQAKKPEQDKIEEVERTADFPF
jgi:ferredoxin